MSFVYEQLPKDPYLLVEMAKIFIFLYWNNLES